jgi:hypothetical protein
MNRLVLLACLVGCCAGCGSSMSTAPVLQPGVFHERTVDDRTLERIGIDFVAETRHRDADPGN